MKDRPEGVSDEDLGAALADGWGLDVRAVEYRPVGFGSYHWAVRTGSGGLFVTVDALQDDPAAALRRLDLAFRTALALRRDAGLDFVVAPLSSRGGAVVRPLGDRHAVAVFPLVEGEAGDFGVHRPEDRPQVLDLLVRLHAAGVEAPRAELVLPGRGALEDALSAVDRPWNGGPYSEPARLLLAGRAAHVRGLLGEFDRLAGLVAAESAPWVVTHGEPHPGNVLRGPAGPRLIDWDTVLLAPPERDLWMVAGDGVRRGGTADDGLLDAYTRATGRPVSAAALSLYRLWWDLADIANYVATLRHRHRRTDDTTASLTYLAGCLNPGATEPAAP
ncbi:phosphotransferase [Streptomyces sp. NPDC020917]|uniref:phosphotransferase n=1 Tax=Streptomyces sp. NPDC020917 TaxID=3365102 RepID=UPI003795D2BB